jgi:predicted dehydrogenase
MKNYNWVVIGCGHIANEMAQAMAEKNRHFYGVFSRTRANAQAFADRYGIEKVYGSADELFADGDADIVYIATPHNRHIDYIRRAAESGKHILCEKAITLNSDELGEAAALCEKHGVILAEAMTIYHLPVIKQTAEFIREGSLGRLKMIEVNLGSNKDYDMTNRFFNPALAGGAMLDIGVYALSFVRYFMSESPTEVKSAVRLAPSGVDEQAVMLLKNRNDEMASVTLSLTARLPRTAVAAFEKGYISFDNYNRSRCAEITFTDGKEPIILTSDGGVSVLTYEIEDMEKAVGGQADEMHLDYTADVMKIMTDARNEWGVKYPEEN